MSFIRNFLRIFAGSKRSDAPADTTIPTEMKYLIVGLGNIGAKYDNTRHNIGFNVVDYIAHQKDLSWETATLGSVAQFKHKGRSITLLKPSTFMNRSGKALNHWMKKLGVPRNNVLVVVDDLHLDLGVLKLKAKGSDGGHNGLKDIQAVLGGSNYPRLRFGIGKDFYPGQQVDFVLGTWKNNEIDEVNETIERASAAVLDFCSIEFKYVMEKYNTKRGTTK